MDMQHALIAFDALSQETRLKTFRLLVQYGTKGAPAGVLSEELGIPHNTLSFHLSHMSNAGLILPRKEGRSVIYTAAFSAMQDLIRFMVKDCCNMEFASIEDSETQGRTLISLSDLPECCSQA